MGSDRRPVDATGPPGPEDCVSPSDTEPVNRSRDPGFDVTTPSDPAEPTDADGNADADADGKTHVDIDVRDVDAVAARREELVRAVRDHAGTVAYQLARLQGGDYGRTELSTPGGEWTVKHEAGELEFLLFSPTQGADTYVISTKRPPDPAGLAAALDDYPAMVAAWNEYVDSLSGVLDDVAAEFPDPASTDGVVAERDRVLDSVRETCGVIAGEIYRYENDDYGTFTARVDGDRWELKWDEGTVSYLRVGGSGGVYLLSQYDAPSAADVREHADAFGEFVEAYNEFVGGLESDLATVSAEDDGSRRFPG